MLSGQAHSLSSCTSPAAVPAPPACLYTYLHQLTRRRAVFPAAAKRRADIFVQKAEEYTDHLAKIYAPYTFYACTFAADNTMVGGVQLF